MNLGASSLSRRTPRCRPANSRCPPVSATLQLPRTALAHRLAGGGVLTQPDSIARKYIFTVCVYGSSLACCSLFLLRPIEFDCAFKARWLHPCVRPAFLSRLRGPVEERKPRAAAVLAQKHAERPVQPIIIIMPLTSLQRALLTAQTNHGSSYRRAKNT